MSVRKKQQPKKSAYSLAKPIPIGTSFTDSHKFKWIIGNPIAQGGFGCIYSVKKDGEKTEQFVAKIEPQENGPLFTEIHFYIRVCTEDLISKWTSEHRLSFLGIPRYVSSGLFTPPGSKPCRYLIMDRFSGDFESLLKKGSLKPCIVIAVAIQVLNALEYLHAKDYAHADIKASNLLYNGSCEKVTLVDFGLVHLFRSRGVHYPAKPNPKFKHNGTIEFCSRDSHDALAPSRRGDLEILLFNLVHWLARCQSQNAQSSSAGLPWGHLIADSALRQNVPERIKIQVAALKKQAMLELSLLTSETGLPSSPDFQRFMQTIASLAYDETPNYELLRQNLNSYSKFLASVVSKQPVHPPSKRTSAELEPQIHGEQPPSQQLDSKKRSRNHPSASRKQKQTSLATTPDTTSRKEPRNGSKKLPQRDASKESLSPLRSPKPTTSLSISRGSVFKRNPASPLVSAPTRSSPRLKAARSSGGKQPNQLSLRLRHIFDSDEEEHQHPTFSDSGTFKSQPERGTTSAARKALSTLNPYSPVTSPIAHQETERKITPISRRKSGFCQTSPELLMVAKAEALGRRAAELANRHVCYKR